jgi:hypothetical protein
MVKFIVSITQDTVYHHHKDHSANPVPGNNLWLLCELYETKDYYVDKMENSEADAKYLLLDIKGLKR